MSIYVVLLKKQNPKIYLYGVNKGYGLGINGSCEKKDKGWHFHSLAFFMSLIIGLPLFTRFETGHLKCFQKAL